MTKRPSQISRSIGVIALTGLLAMILIAGCGENSPDLGDGNSASSTNTPTPTVEIEPTATDESESEDMQQWSEAPEMQLEEGVDYKARLSTNEGTILVDLHEEDAPNTVNNFVFL
ncbi:MAG: peptidylprolyl isomerase, partial [Chloroflexota bacterium]